jgi:RNA polymerase sigma-70 factor (ECF subfamily)
LSEARAGSREALGEALEACRGYLLLIAREELDAELRTKGSASDLVQETFLDAHKDFGHFHGNSEDELRAWLRKLLLNNLANFRRRYQQTDKRKLGREVALPAGSSADRAGELAADLSSPSARAMKAERAEALWRALERLPDDYRQVILLRYEEGQSFEEIARVMQRSENAVRKLWARAVERVQHELETPP